MEIDTQVCIAGGGPAGMMLGLLLARQGIEVAVLEKHADFLRDFRGDTVHPSTLDVLDELGLHEATRRLPHRDVSQLNVSFADGRYTLADFARLRVPHPYVRFMPQWHFLNALAEQAETLPTFRLLRRHEVTDLHRQRGRGRGRGIVTGVEARSPEGPVRVRAGLTVAADGRGSVVRERAGMEVREFATPMDVLWFRVSREEGESEGLDMHIGSGRLALAIDRGEYWQIAYLVTKGGDRLLREAGIDRFRDSVAELMPAIASRVGEISGWDDVQTLSVQLDRLRRWHAPGLLCIGDAAHAMSPVGGVGINLAIQDAVAAARILGEPLRTGRLRPHQLAAVQRRRRLPTVGTQLLQRVAQRFLVQPALGSERAIPAPAGLRLLARVPALQAIPARVVGVGLRPEHVEAGGRGRLAGRTLR